MVDEVTQVVLRDAVAICTGVLLRCARLVWRKRRGAIHEADVIYYQVTHVADPSFSREYHLKKNNRPGINSESSLFLERSMLNVIRQAAETEEPIAPVLMSLVIPRLVAVSWWSARRGKEKGTCSLKKGSEGLVCKAFQLLIVPSALIWLSVLTKVNVHQWDDFSGAIKPPGQALYFYLGVAVLPLRWRHWLSLVLKGQALL